MQQTQTSTWSRLRWPIKAIIIALPLIAALWAANHYGLLNPKQNTTDSTAQTNREPREESNGPTPTEGSTDNGGRSFNFTPPEPQEGVKKGVVDVGATGFNSFVVEIDKQKNWKIVSKEFGESLVYEGLATTDDIRTGLKKYLAGMFERGVQNRNMHFVISSGAQKEPKTAIISSELKKFGYVVNLVTPEQEGKLALKSVQPKGYESSSFVVDIGSGNTKISWYEGGTLRAVEAPGAKYYEKGTDAQAVYDEVVRKCTAIPKANREICFIIGGVPFELAKEVRNGEERFTVLKDPGNYKSDKEKTKAGLNIYNAIQKTTSTDTFVFDWDANYTIGFLLSLPS